MRKQLFDTDLTVGWFSSRPATEQFYRNNLLVGLGIGLLSFGGLKGLLFSSLIVTRAPLVATVLALLAGLGGSWLRASDLTPAARIIYRTTATLFGVYLVASYVPVPEGAPPAAAAWFQYGPWIGLTTALLSYWRPSLALVTYCCVAFHKRLTMQMWEIKVSPTDYVPVIESSTLLVLGAMGIIWYRAIVARRYAVDAKEIEAGALPLVDALVIFVIGIHFANYLWSGIAKLVLIGGGPLGWVIDNPTHVLMEVAVDYGFFNLGYGFWFSDEVREITPAILPLINFGTLIAQLSCILVFWRRWTIAAITAIYDLQHIVIFLLTGIFFWKWIILNSALIIAVRAIDRPRLPTGVAVIGLLGCILAGFAGNFFFVARLGWYDTPSYNRIRAIAVTNDGREAVVPSNYFGPLSVTFAQMRIPTGLPRGFPTGTWGQSRYYSIMNDSKKCALTIDERPASANSALLQRLTRAWHAEVLKRIDADGRIAYDRYPHHIWSDPRRFDAFWEIDKRSIVAYRWERDAVCIDMKGSRGSGRVVDRREILIEVDGQTR